MPEIDRIKVRQSFDRGARCYEDTVVVQKRVVRRILSDLETRKFPAAPRRILDVGAGTGMLLRSLRKHYADAFLVGLDLAPGMGNLAMGSFSSSEGCLYVEGDAENLPFADGTFDLVLSTSAFQWLNTLEAAFAEVWRVLAPGGTFLFALFGENTLYELRRSYREALIFENAVEKDRTHRFFTCRDVAGTLEKSGYLESTAESVCEKEYHADVPSLLRSLRGIGAGNAASLPVRGLGGRRLMKKMMAVYDSEFSEKGRIPASYEVIYGQGVKAVRGVSDAPTALN